MARIFIASSNETLRHAKEFKRELLNAAQRNIEVIGWWENNRIFGPGTMTLDELIQEVQRCDFGVVFFTEDERILKDDQEILCPSSNCIFESGLFIQGLGRERCLILSSVDPNQLPSDLRGLDYRRIARQENGQLDWTNALESLSLDIENLISNLGERQPYESLPLITEERLKELEKGSTGNLITSGHIIVNAFQPLELDNNFSARVISNIIDTDISYTYFFQSSERNIEIIARLIQSLATVHIDAQTPNDRRTAITLDSNKIETQNNLRNLRRKLEIYFFESETPIEYCIHNAEFRDHAQCYLRRPAPDGGVRFVEWSRGRNAYNIAHSLLNLRRPNQNGNFIFRSTTDVDLISDRFIDSFLRPLQEKCLELFPPQLHTDVNEVCFPPNP